MENVPIKIDCFSLPKKEGIGLRKLIGSILIPVRSIPLYSLSKALQIKPKWYRLVGLSSEWREQRPELLLSIMITDKEFFDSRNNLASVIEPVSFQHFAKYFKKTFLFLVGESY